MWSYKEEQSFALGISPRRSHLTVIHLSMVHCNCRLLLLQSQVWLESIPVLKEREWHVLLGVSHGVTYLVAPEESRPLFLTSQGLLPSLGLWSSSSISEARGGWLSPFLDTWLSNHNTADIFQVSTFDFQECCFSSFIQVLFMSSITFSSYNPTLISESLQLDILRLL